MAAALGRRVGAQIGATIPRADRMGWPVPREGVWRKDRPAWIKKKKKKSSLNHSSGLERALEGE